MALTRLGAEVKKDLQPLEVKLENMNVHTELAISSYSKTPDVQRAVNVVHKNIHDENGYLTITEGMREITLISDCKHLPIVDEGMKLVPLHRHDEVAALGLTFSPEYLDRPGLYYNFYQQLYFQNINVIEQASTLTELIFYLHERDVQLAFDTLYNRFVRSPQGG